MAAEESNLEVVEQWGRFKKVAKPGFNVLSCCLGQTVAGKLSTSLLHQEVQFEGKTKDGVWVEMVVSITSPAQSLLLLACYRCCQPSTPLLPTAHHAILI